MAEVQLLRSLPRTRRNVEQRARAKNPELIASAKQFGALYFDGPRECGYGGYRYDGRWIPVARDIVDYYGLKPGQRVIDVGCAKGFLVKDLQTVCPGLKVFGLDISTYALQHCVPEVRGRLLCGSAERLPFPDRSFDAALSINTLHNLPRQGVIRALRELDRLASGRCFIQVDAYHTPAGRALFLDWVLTAEYHDYPAGWLDVFELAGYTGDYDWTVLE
ncbi:methyltransferase [Planctomycetaceae bacterium SCGC AG-212-F19]|nr:methyltransferase [Planctomycetaceae bacterium SCGC AG-212-F19]